MKNWSLDPDCEAPKRKLSFSLLCLKYIFQITSSSNSTSEEVIRNMDKDNMDNDKDIYHNIIYYTENS